MRILYITTDSGWGGSSVALFNIISELKDRHEIYVLLPDANKRLGQELKKNGITCYDKPFGMQTKIVFDENLIISLKHIWWFVRGCYHRFIARKYVEYLLDVLKPDIVHCNVGMVDISLNACKKRGICHIYHLRDYLDVNFFPSSNYIRKKIYDPYNHSITITQQMFDYYELNKDSDMVIYDGVINERKIIQTTPIHTKYFLMVGMIQEIKGVLEGIKAFYQFCQINKEYELWIAGKWQEGSNYKSACDKYIENNHLSNKVKFLGQRDDIPNLMSNAVALLAPNLYEGFGFTIAEAMYYKCIVIGRNLYGIKEQFDIGFQENGKEIGLQFDKDEQVLSLMKKVIHEDLDDMRSRAFDTVCRHYTTKVNATEIEKYYHKCLKKNC